MTTTSAFAYAADLLAQDLEEANNIVSWHCERLDCDGEPHEGFEYKHARGKQVLRGWLPEEGDTGQYRTAYIRGGRRSGKTWAAANHLAQLIKENPAKEWACVGPTFGDARDICMENVHSGLIKVLGGRIGGEGRLVEKGPHILAWNRTTGQLRLRNDGVVYCDGADDGAYRIQGHGLCLAAGEPVLTHRGLVGVDSVVPGDRVLTRAGWRPVGRVVCSGANEPVVAVRTTEGVLRCTPEHRVWVQDRGWVKAGVLQPGDRLISCEQWSYTQGLRPGTTSTESDTSDVVTATTRAPMSSGSVGAQSGSMWPSGSLSTTENSRPATSSTTMIATRRTTTPATSSSCCTLTTPVSTLEKRPAPQKPESGSGSRSPLLGSVGSTRPSSASYVTLSSNPAILGVERGTARGSARSAPSKVGHQRRSSALGVVGSLSTRRTDGRSAATSSAGMNSPRLNDESAIVLDVRPDGHSDVYDLTIDGPPEFFASGVLVHNSGLWGDEVGLWKKWKAAFDESIRYAVSDYPAKVIVTGTPKRTLGARVLVKRLIEDPNVLNVQLHTEENIHNLDPAAAAEFLSSKGTALERQELYGDLLEEVEGALWSIAMWDGTRVEIPRHDPETDPYGIQAIYNLIQPTRVCVAVDPAVSGAEDADEHGIIVAAKGQDGDIYILEDLSFRGAVTAWPPRVIEACLRWEVDRVIAEVNNGGDYIGQTLRSAGYRGGYEVVRATRGKMIRAEPIATFHEKEHVHAVGDFPELQGECCTWVPGEEMDSPNRLDAMVYGAAWLRPELIQGWASVYKPFTEEEKEAAKSSSRAGWMNVYAKPPEKKEPEPAPVAEPAKRRGGYFD